MAHAEGDRLCIFERETAPGEAERTWLVVGESGELAVQVTGREPLELPRGSVMRVFERYGQVFEGPAGDGGEAHSASTDTQLDFAEGLLKRLRHRTWFDVEPRDYLVFAPHAELSDQWPRFELCTSISAALLHLGRAYAARPR